MTTKIERDDHRRRTTRWAADVLRSVFLAVMAPPIATVMFGALGAVATLLGHTPSWVVVLATGLACSVGNLYAWRGLRTRGSRARCVLALLVFNAVGWIVLAVLAASSSGLPVLVWVFVVGAGVFQTWGAAKERTFRRRPGLRSTG